MDDLQPFWDWVGNPAEARRIAAGAFLDDLYETNLTTNLTRVPRAEAPIRHFVDSVLVARAVAPLGRWLDVGSGAGFPAFPLAVAFPGIEMTALDSASKPLRFLARHLLPNLAIKEGRSETRGGERFDVVTGRAVAPFAIQAEISIHWVEIGGAFVPLRTAQDEAAIRAFPAEILGASLEVVVPISLPGGFGERLLPVFRKHAPTKKAFPRSWAEIRARPLV